MFYYDLLDITINFLDDNKLNFVIFIVASFDLELNLNQ